MQNLIVLLIALAGLAWALFALQRAGIQAGKGNRHTPHPPHPINDSMVTAAVLLAGVARYRGELGTDHRRFLLRLFEQEFALDAASAARLLDDGIRMAGDVNSLPDRLETILAVSSRAVSVDQASTLLSMMTRAATLDSALNDSQRKLILATEKYYEHLFTRRPDWKQGTRTQQQ
jgi:uncharacterized tellurite resistance protein B-like protein